MDAIGAGFHLSKTCRSALVEGEGHLRRMSLQGVIMVSGRGGCVTRRCFVSDRARLVMPAFGAFAGGLNVRARPFSDVFGTLGFVAYMLGEERIYALASSRCLAE